MYFYHTWCFSCDHPHTHQILGTRDYEFVSKIEMKQGMNLSCLNIQELSNELSLHQDLPNHLSTIYSQSFKSYACLAIFAFLSIVTQIMQMMQMIPLPPPPPFSYSFSKVCLTSYPCLIQSSYGFKVYIHSCMASSGSCFMVTWIICKNHLLEVGLTQNWETMVLRFIIFYHVWGPCMNKNSVK